MLPGRLFTSWVLILLAAWLPESASASDDFEERWFQARKRAAPSTAAILAVDSQGAERLSGFGFFVEVNGDAQLLTRAHVLRRQLPDQGQKRDIKKFMVLRLVLNEQPPLDYYKPRIDRVTVWSDEDDLAIVRLLGLPIWPKSTTLAISQRELSEYRTAGGTIVLPTMYERPHEHPLLLSSRLKRPPILFGNVDDLPGYGSFLTGVANFIPGMSGAAVVDVDSSLAGVVQIGPSPEAVARLETLDRLSKSTKHSADSWAHDIIRNYAEREKRSQGSFTITPYWKVVELVEAARWVLPEQGLTLDQWWALQQNYYQSARHKIARGIIELTRDEPKIALPLFEQAIALDPNSVRGHFFLALSLLLDYWDHAWVYLDPAARDPAREQTLLTKLPKYFELDGDFFDFDRPKKDLEADEIRALGAEYEFVRMSYTVPDRALLQRADDHLSRVNELNEGEIAQNDIDWLQAYVELESAIVVLAAAKSDRNKDVFQQNDVANAERELALSLPSLTALLAEDPDNYEFYFLRARAYHWLGKADLVHQDLDWLRSKLRENPNHVKLQLLTQRVEALLATTPNALDQK